MAGLRWNIFYLFVFSVTLQCTVSQVRNTAPEIVQSCYLNTTALNRGFRQPMHIDNLIAIIRKIEDKTSNIWDMRRVARTIVKIPIRWNI